MVSAVWNGATIAASEVTVIVDGNHYFPPEAVDQSRLEASDHSSVCPVKGSARYFHVRAGGERNPDAAWTYPDPTRPQKPKRSGVISHSGRAWRLRRPRLGGGR